MTPRVQIVRDAAGRADVYSPYQALDVVKATVPSSCRNWSKARKCWTVREPFIDTLADALRVAGYAVFVTNADGSRAGTRGGRARTPAPDWVEAAFAACPPDRVDRLRRSLLSALHPDVGGDPELAKRINAVADQRAKGATP